MQIWVRSEDLMKSMVIEVQVMSQVMKQLVYKSICCRY